MLRQKEIGKCVLGNRGLKLRRRGLCQAFANFNLCTHGCGRPLLVKAVCLHSVNLGDFL